MKTARIQIVGRLPGDLNRGVRAAAKRRKISLNAFLIDALTQAVGAPTPPRKNA
jgi:predicted HicB family RNase H-like nuclease